jgi:hypothetical protein
MAITELKPYLSNIADKLKSLLGITDKINAQDFVEKIDEVYEKSRLDTWNKITNNNTRTFYTYAYREMPDGCFDPPFAVKPRNAEGMFQSSKITKITTEQLDLSECGNFPAGFANCYSLREVGIVDLRKNGNNALIFNNTDSLHTVEKVILKDEGQNLGNAFFCARALANIEIEGKISETVYFGYSPLTHESLMSIINALKDYSGTTSTYTLTLHADAKARLSDAEKAIITQKGWTLA